MNVDLLFQTGYLKQQNIKYALAEALGKWPRVCIYAFFTSFEDSERWFIFRKLARSTHCFEIGACILLHARAKQKRRRVVRMVISSQM